MKKEEWTREALKKRCLPDLLYLESKEKVNDLMQWEKRREELLCAFRQEMYGLTPADPVSVEQILEYEDKNLYGGKGWLRRFRVQFETDFGFYSFPYTLLLPEKRPSPVFLYLSFTGQIPDEQVPAEEILDHGFGIACVYYEAIVPDRPDNFRNGLGAMFRRNPFDGPGKISLWAYGASRVMDCLVMTEGVDDRRVIIAGHSRLGKSALWCGAQDSRFYGVISNDSGGSGAALSRGKKGEQVGHIVKGDSREWFCGNYRKYAGQESLLPFDQHALLALVMPRRLYVSSSSKDSWADPESEFLCCVAASPVYQMAGKKGLVCEDTYPVINKGYHEGYIGYHVRRGSHSLNRQDWQLILQFYNRHIPEDAALEV